VGFCSQGLSTDFYRACQLILERLQEAQVPAEEAPEDLLVLTDMGWDAAATTPGVKNHSKNHWKSQVQVIRDEYATAGYKAPRIVIWNLRAEYKDFHAAPEDDGVVMVSGWSPNVLTALQRDGVQTRTPLEGLRAALDVPRYDAVRLAIRGLV
jgi:hypothetical protein